MIVRITALAIAATALASASSTKTVMFKRTPQGELNMTFFFPADWKPSDRRPGIVLFFGGGFRGGSTRQFFSKAQYLASRGLVAASAEYRVSSRHMTTPAESMEDCKSAIRWVRKNSPEFGIDPGKLIGGGGSAGATCAIMAALDDSLDAKEEDRSVSSRPDALVLYNPAMELPPQMKGPSPNSFIKAGAPPTIMFFGTADPLLEPARKYWRRALAEKNRVELYTAKDQKHGFFNDNSSDDYSWHASTLYVTDTFLRPLGYTTGRPTIAMPLHSKAVLYRENSPADARTAVAPKGVRLHSDLVYATTPEKELKLDLYVPENPAAKPLPLLIWIHGGAFRAGTKTNPPALRLFDHGYAVASIAYRLSQEAAFPAQSYDCKGAVRWLRANASKYNLDPNRFGVWGSSAGGYLVAMLGTSGGVPELEGKLGNEGVSSRVQAVVDFFGPTKFLRISAFPGNLDHDAPDSPLSQLIGAPVQQNPELAERANPIRYVTADDPPFLIVHGDADPQIPMEQSELLHAALRKAGVESKLMVLPGAGHGGPQFSSPETLREIVAFFDRHLKK